MAETVDQRSPAGMPARHALLLACDGRDHGRVAELAPPVDDWDALLRLAAQHAVQSRLYASLLAAGANHAVPPALWHTLKARYQENAARNLKLTATLLRLLDALSVQGVRALPYKGPALAQSAYGNLALREMADLDLLISPAQLGDAQRVVAELGYRPLLTLTPRQQAAYLRSEGEYDFVSADGSLLDLHWQLAPRHHGIGFDFDAAWERRRLLGLGGRQIPALSAEDTVLVVAVHGSKHLWERLGWLHDLAACLRAGPLDWSGLLARASTQGARDVLLLGLHLAHELLAADLPADVRREIERSPRLRSLAQQWQQRFLAGDGTVSDAQRWVSLLRLAPGWRRRLRCAAGFAFTSGVAEWSAVTLPDSMFPLYRVVRLGRLAGSMLGGNSDPVSRGRGRVVPR